MENLSDLHWLTYGDIETVRRHIAQMDRDYQLVPFSVALPFPAVATDIIGFNQNRVAATFNPASSLPFLLLVGTGPLAGHWLFVSPDNCPFIMTLEEYGPLVMQAWQGQTVTAAVSVAVMEITAR